MSETSTGTLPDRSYCGDGVVDSDEECDDGVERNALEGACLPDCNLNVCGDGNLAPTEGCDDGEDDNVLEIGACAPDCSRIIETKELGISVSNGDGNFFPNPLGVADGLCPAGSKALLALPGQRQATNGTPYAADDPIDWPLQPYTAYVTASNSIGPAGELIWITDGTALLGVRDGRPVDLLRPIFASPQAPALGVATGMNADWTNLLTDNCNGWQSDSPDAGGRVGSPASTDEFLDDRDYNCSGSSTLGTLVYCVEQ
ncbi:MAG: DUF1554 domain-containing protein [Myxococcota bacterium]